MNRSPFLLNIADLARPHATPRTVDVDAAVDWAVELSRVLPDPPLRASLQLAPTSGGLVVTGTVDVAAEHTCHRCLDDTTAEVHVEIAQLYVLPGEDTDDEDEYVLEGDELDLEPMVRDEVLLAMPLVPTCGPDCPGVPPGASVDASDDDEAAETSPFAALQDLFDED